MRQQPPLGIGGGCLAHERGGLRRTVALETRGPGLELRRGRPPGTQSRVDGEQQFVGNGCELGCALEALGEREASRGPCDLGLSAEGVGCRADLGCIEASVPERLQRDLR